MFWKEKHELFAKMEKEGGQIKVVAQFKKNDQGMEYVTFSVGIIKTRQSGLHDKHRLIILKMFATDTEHCPIRFFKLYLPKGPKCLQKNGPFYL